MIELTKELLEEGSTSRMTFSWTDRQCDILGVEKVKGWKDEVIGNHYSQEQIDEFLEIGNQGKVRNSRNY